jgi:ABC-type glycerol-3-phosphate transport system substrate-binding protein
MRPSRITVLLGLTALAVAGCAGPSSSTTDPSDAPPEFARKPGSG